MISPLTLGVQSSAFMNAEPNTRAGAIVVTEIELGVFGEGSDVTWLPYLNVKWWEKLSKDPISRSLIVLTQTGGRVELPFPRGGAFGFVQFLDRAMWWANKGKKQHDGSSQASE